VFCFFSVLQTTKQNKTKQTTKQTKQTTKQNKWNVPQRRGKGFIVATLCLWLLLGRRCGRRGSSPICKVRNLAVNFGEISICSKQHRIKRLDRRYVKNSVKFVSYRNFAQYCRTARIRLDFGVIFRRKERQATSSSFRNSSEEDTSQT